MRVISLLLCLFVSGCFCVARGQDTSGLYGKAYRLPDKLFSAIEKKGRSYQDKITRQTRQYLRKLAGREEKLKKKLARTDPARAEQLFGNTDSVYRAMGGIMNHSTDTLTTLGNSYSGHLDSMQTALRYLQRYNLLDSGQILSGQLGRGLDAYRSLQGRLNGAGSIGLAAAQRQQWLQDQLQNTPLAKGLQDLKKQVYYYRAQIDGYKQTLQSPEKAAAVLLDALRRLPSFQSFFARNSQLAGLFRLPGSGGGGMDAVLAGLQTRDQVLKEIQAHLGGGGNLNELLESRVSEGQSGLSGWKGKLDEFGSPGSISNSAGADGGAPDFRPNNQRTKTFLRRIEWGANLQTNRSSAYYPVTADVGLTLGYRISDKATAGIGASYKVGLGQDIHHMAYSSQGAALRTFLDVQLKGAWWVSGGGEMNYLTAFDKLSDLKQIQRWQQSALLGITRKYKMGKKLNGNIQVLYDLLWSQHKPATQPVVFRLGYQF